MSFLSGVKNYLLELIDENSEQSVVVRWASISPRFENLLLLLQNLNAQANRTPPKGAKKSNAETEIIRGVTHAINELLPTLEHRRFLFGNDPALFYHIRLVLLRIWRIVLRMVKSHFYQKRLSQKIVEKKREKGAPPTVDEGVDGVFPRFPSLTMNDLSTLFRAINCLMTRTEFSLEHLKLDKNGTAHCQEADLDVAQRYRCLLINTQAVAQEITNFYIKSGQPLSRIVIGFLARVFAVNSFRLPKVPSLIVSAVGLSDELHSEVERFLTDRSFERSNNDTFYSSPARPDEPTEDASHPGHNGAAHVEHSPASPPRSPVMAPEPMVTSSDEPMDHDIPLPMAHTGESMSGTPTESPSHAEDHTPQARLLTMARAFPDLFQWAQFHAVVLSYKADAEGEKIKSGPWLQEFQKKDSTMFFMFMHEWVQHICAVTQQRRSLIDWPTIRGYRVFVPTFVFAMKRTHDYTKDLQESSCSMLLTQSSLINFYMHHLFERTSVHNVMATLNAISMVEIWFMCMLDHQVPLPENFEASFLAKALDIMFQTDHHQILTRALTMLYAILDGFLGEARVTIVIDLLLHKYFFPLFLHWDASIRNCYQQLLLFKGTHAKRSLLVAIRTSNDPTINGPDMYDMEHITDTVVFTKVESYWRMLSDQLAHKEAMKDFPSHLEVYTTRAMQEFCAYKEFYNYWETTNSPPPPRIIPYASLNQNFKR